MNYHDVIRVPVVTEKTEEQKNPRKDVNRYTVRVHPDANKELIKQALHHVYKVRAVKINVMMVPGKMKRFRQGRIKLPTWKKAVITLAPGQTVDFAAKS